MNGQNAAALDIIRVGPSVNLTHLNAVAKDFEINIEKLRPWLDDLGVPVIHINDEPYLNLFSLEKALFVATRAGERTYDDRPDEFRLLMEMSIATMNTATATREVLRERIRKMGEWIIGRNRADTSARYRAKKRLQKTKGGSKIEPRKAQCPKDKK